MTQNIRSLKLLSPDIPTVREALTKLGAKPLKESDLPALLAVMFFHSEKSIRDEAKKVVADRGSDALVERFQKDRRAYHKIERGPKLAKIAKDLDKDLGIDPIEFTRAMLVEFINFREPIDQGEALFAALKFKGNAPDVFELLKDQTEVTLENIKKEFPPGLSALSAVETLFVTGGPIKKATNLDELGKLKNLRRLNYRVEDVDLKLLEPLNHIREIEFAGGLSAVSDISELSSWTNLEHLDLKNSAITDISPIAKLTRLKHLDIAETKVSNLDPLRELKNLQYLNIKRIKTPDLSVLQELPNIEQLYLDFLDVGDLSFLERAKKLNFLSLWGAKISDFKVLVGLPLEKLDILHTKLPDLSPLTSISTLKVLRLVGTSPPKEFIETLKKEIPNIYISL